MYTLSPLYAFTSLVSLTVASCVSCFLHSTVVVRAMIAVKSLHHPTNHCLSHSSLLAPHETQVPDSCLLPATSYHLPLVPSFGHYTFCSFKPGYHHSPNWSVVPPFSPTLLGQGIRQRVAIAVFCSRSVPVFSNLCPNRCFSARLWAFWLGLLLFL